MTKIVLVMLAKGEQYEDCMYKLRDKAIKSGGVNRVVTWTWEKLMKTDF